MEIIVVMAMILFIVAAVYTVLHLNYKKEKRRQRQLLVSQLAAYARANKLRFNKQELVGYRGMLALDEVNRKFLYIEPGFMNIAGSCTLVDLTKVKRCIIKSNHREVYVTGSKNTQRLAYKIKLHFEFTDETPDEAITVFSSGRDGYHLMAEQRRKAIKWNNIIDQLLKEKEQEKTSIATHTASYQMQPGF